MLLYLKFPLKVVTVHNDRVVDQLIYPHTLMHCAKERIIQLKRMQVYNYIYYN